MIQTLDSFADKPEEPKKALRQWEFPSLSKEEKIYVVTEYKDGTFDCKDEKSGMPCLGDKQTIKHETGRCRHIGGIIKALGMEVPGEERKIKDRINKVLKMIITPAGIQADIAALTGHKMQMTSLKAYHDWLFQEELGAKQGRVLKYIIGHPGSTDMEIASGLRWPINTVTPRRGELVPYLVEHTGYKDNPGTGKMAMTWKATKLATDWEK